MPDNRSRISRPCGPLIRAMLAALAQRRGRVGQTALRAAWTMSACVSPLPLVFAERLGADGVTDGTAFRLVRGLGLLQRHLGGAHLGAGHVGYAEGVVPQAIEQGARIECGRFAPRARALASRLPRWSRRVPPSFCGARACHRRACRFTCVMGNRPAIRHANASAFSISWARQASMSSARSSINRFDIGAVGLACYGQRLLKVGCSQERHPFDRAPQNLSPRRRGAGA
jgi:hypothetical protein